MITVMKTYVGVPVGVDTLPLIRFYLSISAQPNYSLSLWGKKKSSQEKTSGKKSSFSCMEIAFLCVKMKLKT